MTINTRWNIGDKAWGLILRHLKRTVPCQTCNGEGGATIPGTKVLVKCQNCEGNRTVEENYKEFDLTEIREISSIEVRIKQYHANESSKIETTYWGYYRHAVHPERFEKVFATEQEARDYIATQDPKLIRS